MTDDEDDRLRLAAQHCCFAPLSCHTHTHTHISSVLGKLLFKSNLSMSTITWLEK